MTDELNQNQDDQLSAAERVAKECDALSEAEQVEYSNARAIGLSHAEAIELVKDTSDEPAAADTDATDVVATNVAAIATDNADQSEAPAADSYVPEPEAPAVVDDTPIDTPIPAGINDHRAYDAPKRGEN